MLGKTLVQILKESKYTTVLSGVGMPQESEYPAIRDGEESYDIESRYGYSIEEMFSSSFYSTRKVLLFMHRKRRKDTIPFIPFLLAAYLILLIL